MIFLGEFLVQYFSFWILWEMLKGIDLQEDYVSIYDLHVPHSDQILFLPHIKIKTHQTFARSIQEIEL